jgi:hypothetical protein
MRSARPRGTMDFVLTCVIVERRDFNHGLETLKKNKWPLAESRSVTNGGTLNQEPIS